MQRLACGQAIKLQLSECSAVPTSAILQRAGFADIPLTLTPADADEVVLATPPSQPARGVWQLRVTSECGCYHAQIAVDACKPISFAATHTSSRHDGIVTVCCDPDEGDDIVFDSFTLSAGDIVDGEVALTYPLAPGTTPIVWVVGGLIQQFDEDYIVVGTELSWFGRGLADLLEEGDILQIHYQRAP